MAIELVNELIEIDVPADTYLFDTSYCCQEFVTCLETYYIWTQKLEVSRLGEVKILITRRESREEDEEPSVKYIVSSKIDAPASHLIALYAMRWRVEAFFRDTKQDLDFGDFDLRHAAGASRHCHLLMLAYSLLKLVAAHSALGTMLDRATSLRTDTNRSFRESVENLLSWALNNRNRSTDELM